MCGCSHDLGNDPAAQDRCVPRLPCAGVHAFAPKLHCRGPERGRSETIACQCLQWVESRHSANGSFGWKANIREFVAFAAARLQTGPSESRFRCRQRPTRRVLVPRTLTGHQQASSRLGTASCAVPVFELNSALLGNHATAASDLRRALASPATRRPPTV